MPSFRPSGRRTLAALCLLAAASLAPVARAEDSGAAVAVVNDSSREIHHLYVSPTREPKWGSDQLADDVLAPGEKLALTGLECDAYDVKVVDGDGAACILQAVELCDEESGWRLTDEDLASCGS